MFIRKYVCNPERIWSKSAKQKKKCLNVRLFKPLKCMIMIALSFVSALVLTTYYFQIQSSLTTYVLSVNSSSHQGRWVSGIALLLAAPTIGRTARDAIRYRTPTDIFNFNVEMISLFNFIMQCNVMKSFLEQYSTPDETKIKYKCHLQSLDRNMFSTFFSIKLIISTYVCLIFGKALQISSSPAHLCHWGLTSKKSWTEDAAVTAFGIAEEQTLIKSKVALMTSSIWK